MPAEVQHGGVLRQDVAKNLTNSAACRIFLCASPGTGNGRIDDMLALALTGALSWVNEPASAILSVQLRSPMAKLTQINGIIRRLLTISSPAASAVDGRNPAAGSHDH
jgi:hypothetical protein